MINGQNVYTDAQIEILRHVDKHGEVPQNADHKDIVVLIGAAMLRVASITDTRVKRYRLQPAGNDLLKRATAPTELDAARKEIDRLRTVLQPFADAWLDYEATIDADDETTFEDFTKLRWDWDSVTYNYEKAAEALATAPADAAEGAE